jgi:hypothetical protein
MYHVDLLECNRNEGQSRPGIEERPIGKEFSSTEQPLDDQPRELLAAIRIRVFLGIVMVGNAHWRFVDEIWNRFPEECFTRLLVLTYHERSA